MKNLSKVVFIGSDIEANYIGSLLKEEGIEYSTRNAYMSSITVGWVDGCQSQSTEVTVLDEDAERASKVIDDYLSNE